jgi:lactoylglutathione lyase
VRIEHIAIWTRDLERLREFYVRYFRASCGEKYYNPKKQFESYFLSFESGSRVEIMSTPAVSLNETPKSSPSAGLAHFAVSVGSKEKVDLMTAQFRADGFVIAGEPRTTGDGYYESVVLDPDGNLIEITI